jgi:hypothetical protein
MQRRIKMFSKKLIFFNVFHAGFCYVVTVVTILILGDVHFPEYSLFEKALRVMLSLSYFIGSAYFFGLYVIRYFSKFIDAAILWRISVYISPMWILLSAFLYRALKW